MKNTRQFLEDLHKDIGRVTGEVCIAITITKISGGKRTLARWSENLRRAADDIDEQLKALEEKENKYGRLQI